MRRRCGQRRAYTLIEVIIVMTIIAIAAAIVVPQMLKAGTMTAQAAGRSIIADLLWAQNDAIARQRPRRVTFDSANDLYKVEKDTDGDGTWEPIPAQWRTGNTNTGNYEVDFNVDSRYVGVEIVSAEFPDAEHNYIDYDDIGSPSTGGNVVIESQGTRYRIDVTPMTGRVTITNVTAGG